MDNCILHGQKKELICFDCSKIFCSMCISSHPKHDVIHYVYLKDINSNSKSRDKKENYFKKRIEEITDYLFLLAKESKSLENDEKKVIEHFKDWHEYLIILEHRIKKPILENQERIDEDRKSKVNELVELANIINICQGVTEKSTPDDSHLGQEDVIDEEEVTNPLYKFDPKILYESEELKNTRYLASKYQQHLKANFKGFDSSFINELNISNNNNEYSNSDLDLALLKKIDNYFENYTSRNKNINCHNHKTELKIKDYSFSVNSLAVQKIKKQIEESVRILEKDSRVIKVVPNSTIHNGDLSGVQVKNDTHKGEWVPGQKWKGRRQVSLEKDQRKEIIFIASSYGSQLMDLQKQSVETLDITSNFLCTNGSMVTVGDCVYIFGGSSDIILNKKYYIFSSKEKKIVFKGSMTDIDHGYLISTCYDGADRIYLINGEKSIFGNSKRIDCFNIQSKTFEKITEFPNDYVQILSFYYKDKIYSLAQAENDTIKVFDPSSKLFTSFKFVQESFKASCLGACTDGNGNIYVALSNMKFFKLDVNSKKIEYLANSQFGKTFQQDTYPMLYHNAESNMNLIYLMGGKNGNYCYSVEDNKWWRFFIKDSYDRTQCGAALIIQNNNSN